jgi:hypothetical protein
LKFEALYGLAVWVRIHDQKAAVFFFEQVYGVAAVFAAAYD